MAVSTGPHDVLAVGPYRLERVLGEGGMGVVHLSHDRHGNAVAVKVLRPHVVTDADARLRLAREVATMRRVRGPHVAQVVDADVDGERPYLVTSFVPGESLDRLVRRAGPLGLQQLLGLGAGLADALASVHSAGVVHRDLKPGNVLVDAGRPVVIDFGIAQLVDDVQLTMLGTFFGTPGYLAPEVVHGERATAASDMASWAATLAFAATGRPPYGSGPVEVVLGRTGGGLLELAGVPAELAPVLLAAVGPPECRPTAEQARSWMEHLARETPGTRLLTAPQQQHGATYLLTGPAPGPAPRTPPHSGIGGTTRQFPSQHPTPAPAAWPVPPVGVSPPVGGELVTPYGPPAVPAPPAWAQRPARVGGLLLVLSMLAVLGGVLALAPVIGVMLSGGVLLIAGTAARSARRTEGRRALRGRRATDPLAATGTLPWHLVQSLPAAALALLTGAMGLVVGTAVGLYLGRGDASLEQLAMPAAVGGALAAWYGPGHARRGTAAARLSACLRPTATGIAVVVLVLAAVLVWSVAAQSPLDWFPWQHAPVHRSDFPTRLPGS